MKKAEEIAEYFYEKYKNANHKYKVLQDNYDELEYVNDQYVMKLKDIENNLILLSGEKNPTEAMKKVLWALKTLKRWFNTKDLEEVIDRVYKLRNMELKNMEAKLKEEVK